MPHLFTQTAKLFEKEATAATREQVWPFIDDVPSRKLYT
jgi:hypothetical protein